MRKGLIRTALACIGSVVLAHPVLAAQVSHEAADAQLRAIYDAQWKWWKEQMAEEPDDERPGNESGHLPQVDAAVLAGLWFIAGSLAQCRIYSKYLALQIRRNQH